MKLSIIIPIYNVEPYLRKCVNSLIHQDFADYEVVLVDDGSTDGSGKICDEIYESINDERLAIRVIHQENRGLSAARNAGLKVAKGEYVCFVDSDDYWEENVLGGLMVQVEREDLDVLRFDHQNVRMVRNGENGENGGMYEVFEPNKSPRYIDQKNEVVDGVTYLNTRMGYACYAWQLIIRRELLVGTKTQINTVPAINKDKEDEIIKNAESTVADSNFPVMTPQSPHEQALGLLDDSSRDADTAELSLHDSLQKNVIFDNCEKNEKNNSLNDGMSRADALNEPLALNDACLFSEGIHFEDVEWLPRMMLRVKRVNSTTKVVYNYLVRQGSITKTQGDKAKIRKNVEDRLSIVDKYGQYREQHPECKWLYNMQSSMVAGVLMDIAMHFYPERNKYITRLRELNVFPLSIMVNQGRTYIRRARIINHIGPRIFCAIMHLR